MSTSGLAPPGSSTYQSSTMYVGDGTWDAQRNTFLLPNLVGLNFNTMRYNGMGNRFLELPGYHSLIRAHGVIAAITFLVIVPAAIMINRFYTKSWLAIRYHIWLQILTVLLTTVIFVLGYFAVGPERSLTNPHHGIGLAIYILVLVQFIGGWLVHRRLRRKRLVYIPVKLKLHKWLGRIIALLGLAQIPLGLTLYGSPLALFVLYTLAVFALVAVYFTLDHVQERRTREYNSDYSYASGSGSVVNDRRQHNRLGTLAEGAAAGAGLAALANRFRRKSGNQERPEVIGSRRHSGSFIEEEKYSDYEDDRRGRGKWTDRLLGLGAAVGAGALAAKVLGRKRQRDVETRDDEVREDVVRHDDLNNRRFGPPPGRATEISEDSLGRVEEGRVRPSRQHPPNQAQSQPLNQPLHHRRSTSSLSYESYLSGSPSRRRGHGLRDTVAGIGAFGFARNILNNRRKRKEDRRLEAVRQRELEDERAARANGQRLTGDGFPRRAGRRGSLTTSTDYSADDRPRRDHGIPPPLASGAIPAGLAGATADAVLADRDRQHNSLGASNPAVGGAVPGEHLPMPPVIQDPQGIHQNSSGSDVFTSTGGRHHRRHHSGRDAAAAGIAGGAAGLLAGEALANRREESRNRREESRNRRASAGEGSVASPPVSVKVKMHSDGRHVTLRRLPEQEAAAERVARRQSRDSKGRRRRGHSASSLSGTDVGGGERWRRAEAIERQQAAEMEREKKMMQQRQQQPPLQPPLSQQQAVYPPPAPTSQQTPYNPPIHNPHNLPLPNTLPPPPPIPQDTTPLGQSLSRPGTANLSSPGTYDGTATEASADYANNRRRRRAERAQAKLAREGGGRVEFS